MDHIWVLGDLPLNRVLYILRFIEPSKYQEKCEALYRNFKDRIEAIVPTALIVHIGSSSIPGLISKGDLDIYVGVEESEHADSVEKLTDAGYTIKKDTLRTEQLCMLETENRNVALQIVARGSKFDRAFLSFSERMRSSEALKERYNQLKRESIDLSETEYRERKAKFIESVLADV